MRKRKALPFVTLFTSVLLLGACSNNENDQQEQQAGSTAESTEMSHMDDSGSIIWKIQVDTWITAVWKWSTTAMKMNQKICKMQAIRNIQWGIK
ncbi:hypothetical protein HRD57_05930 [Tetragenococcus halophilus]|nr:hypothetical protein [Tetragenococcus halophilus]